MEIIILYLEAWQVEACENNLGRKMTWEERQTKMHRVKVDSPEGAKRLVDHFRLNGCYAYIEEVSQD